MPDLNTYWISKIEVELSSVIDCREIATLGISLDDLLNDHDYTTSQRLAASALTMGAEGLLVPSATRLGDNLVVFPTQFRPDSRLNVTSSRDPVLYVERPQR
jgi:RES domain-containing protein